MARVIEALRTAATTSTTVDLAKMSREVHTTMNLVFFSFIFLIIFLVVATWGIRSAYTRTTGRKWL